MPAAWSYDIMLPILFNLRAGMAMYLTNTTTVAVRKLKKRMPRMTVLNSPKYSKKTTDKKAAIKMPLE
jgi:hypothetical protein